MGILFKLFGIGYDEEGYDFHGYDRKGYDRDGYSKAGYNFYGFDKNGYDVEGYNKWGYDQSGYDRDGLNAEGYDRSGYDRNGYNSAGFDKNGYNKRGYDQSGYSRDGYDKDGRDRSGYNRKGYNSDGYDRRGYNKKGLNRDGFDRNGFNTDGFDRFGFGSDGYNSAGFDKSGYSKQGYDQCGYDRNGYNADGYNYLGLNREGYGSDGYDNRGYDKSGYDRSGFNTTGYNKAGFNRHGYKKAVEATLKSMQSITAIGIGLASPERICEWSRGEVKKPETINYSTLKPEIGGLFCEKIFGPTKDWECHCGKYKKIRYKGTVCDRCGVEVTKSKVRRERLGHIKLAAPVSHIWYFRGIPSSMGLLLDMSPRNLEKVLYFASYVVVDPGMTSFTQRQVINEKEYRDAIDQYGRTAFRAKMGAEAIKEILVAINIDTLASELRAELRTSEGQKKVRIIKRLEVVEAFKKSGNRPEWMILDVLPVLPPELRPMVQLEGKRYRSSDLNDHYRRIINRNNRLNKLIQLGSPEVILRNEKRMLQEAVDALIDNGRRGRPVTGACNRPLKSLSDTLKGKQGKFRQNLLGKSVDYSGRSVIVVGPELKMHQCGLPKEMALELFKPFVMHKIVASGHAHNRKTALRLINITARGLIDHTNNTIWDALEEVIMDHPVLLNRAPTLHRLGIQAFEPILVEGRAIKLHPLVCAAFNADFDGDEMAVHVPLSPEAQTEARFLMLSVYNLIKPVDGKVITVPTQDMVLGIYYLTSDKEDEKGEGKVFSSVDEAIMAYDQHDLGLHARIKVRISKKIAGKLCSRLIESTLGRFIFNEIIPQNLGFIDRSMPGNELKLECDFQVSKKELTQIIERCIRITGLSQTAHILEQIKAMGFYYSTRSGISISLFDLVVPDVKKHFISNTEEKVDYINRQHQRGLLNDECRYKAVVDIWCRTTDSITDALKNNLGQDNPVYMMSQSGARGNINQYKQLIGMRGNMSDISGKPIEIPIKSNLREGMNVLEFFISSHGARKTLSNTALKTADAGYLTRRLADVAQDVIIRELDCGTEEYVSVSEVTVGGSSKSKRIVESLFDRISDRFAALDILHPESGKIIVGRNQLINDDIACKIISAGIRDVPIRSVLVCRMRHGVCTLCYGINLATGEPAVIGDAVGIIAAQSIGEPGTQLTMRTFHTGGIASGNDITQGLPRVEELFEARKPKGQAIISELDGVVRVEETGKRIRDITVTSDNGETITHSIPLSTPLLASSGDTIEAGDLLTDGSVNPHDILRIKGVRGVQQYIIREVLKVYKNNGVEINDKHIEIIVRQMMRKVRIDDSGDTDLLTGNKVDMFDFEKENARILAAGLAPATGKRILLGITKASLATDSFLSAASFQETTRVLKDAAVKGKVDPLIGLKENVIIGKLIPAGTGIKAHNNITAVPVVEQNMDLLEI